MEYSEDTRRFVVINTTEYNNDGCFAVQVVPFDKLEDLGFHREDDIPSIDGLLVGEETRDFDFRGVIVIRVA